MKQLVDFTSSGLYCPIADLYIDPWKPVDRAIITHAHADHARIGNRAYLAHKDTVPMLKHNLGNYIDFQALEYGETIYENGVKISLHPAGHIVGSAQVRLEYQGEVWVVSGDFKLTSDNISADFEPLKCDVFVMDSTFGLPLFQWKPQDEVFNEINNWWAQNKADGKQSILIGYTLGKTQRLIYHLDKSIGNIYAHGSIEKMNTILRRQGVAIPEINNMSLPGNQPTDGSLVLAMPNILHSMSLSNLEPYSIAIASGWMSLRGMRNVKGIDTGFILSDHADWAQLQRAVKETGAQKIYLTSSGYSAAFGRWLRDTGYDVTEVATKFTGETGEIMETLGVNPGDF